MNVIETIADYKGLKFFDAQMNTLEVLEYSERYKGYLLCENGRMNGMYTIVQEQEIEFYLSNQDKYIESDKRYRVIEQEEQRKEEQIQFEYNNTYGYTDNLPAMAKGKMLKILNTKENYSHNGESLGQMKRKDFLKSMIDKGYTLEHKTNIKYYAKNGELKTKTNEYRMNLPDNSFYVITKTEYDYGMYLTQTLITASFISLSTL